MILKTTKLAKTYSKNESSSAINIQPSDLLGSKTHLNERKQKKQRAVRLKNIEKGTQWGKSLYVGPFGLIYILASKRKNIWSSAGFEPLY